MRNTAVYDVVACTDAVDGALSVDLATHFKTLRVGFLHPSVECQIEKWTVGALRLGPAVRARSQSLQRDTGSKRTLERVGLVVVPAAT